MTNKTVIIMAHPDLDDSVLNITIKKELETNENIVYKDLMSLYGDFNIDVKKEQEDLKDAKKIVFQFPMYWYSSPALLKHYVDEVFSYDFAYKVDEKGFQALALRHKEFQLIVTMGSREESFSGEGRLSVKECLNSHSYTAKMLGMKELKPCFFYGAIFDFYTENDFRKMKQILKENIL